MFSASELARRLNADIDAGASKGDMLRLVRQFVMDADRGDPAAIIACPRNDGRRPLGRVGCRRGRRHRGAARLFGAGMGARSTADVARVVVCHRLRQASRDGIRRNAGGAGSPRSVHAPRLIGQRVTDAAEPALSRSDIVSLFDALAEAADDLRLLYELAGFGSPGAALDAVSEAYPGWVIKPNVQYMVEAIAAER